MRIAVRYFSKSGNTRKLADAIAETSGVEAFSIETVLDQDVDILFLGSSVYAASVSGQVKSFIKSIDKKVGKVVHFGTSGTGASTFKKVKKLIEAENFTMEQSAFDCKGSFMKINKGRPNEEDVNEAVKFTKEMINGQA